MRLTPSRIDIAIDAFIAHYKTAVDLDEEKIFDEREVRRWAGMSRVEETQTEKRCLYFWRGRANYMSPSLEKANPRGEIDIILIPMQYLSNETNDELRSDALQLQNSLVKKVFAMLGDNRDASIVQPFNYSAINYDFRWKYGDGQNGRLLIYDSEELYKPGDIFPFSRSVMPDGWYASVLTLTLQFDNQN